MTLGTILWGKFCCTNLFFKEPKIDIEESAILWGCSKIQFIQSGTKSCRVKKQEKCGTCSDGKRKYYYGKEKRDSKFTNYS
jgi:hypothetical protein